MSLSSHLQELRKKHAALDEKIEDAQRPGSSVPSETITELKKQKLRIKEEIGRLTTSHHSAVAAE